MRIASLCLPVTATLACVALLAACGSGNGSPSSSPTTQGQSSATTGTAPTGGVQSTNWSGYALAGSAAQYSGASASWTVPAVSCASGASTASSTWVGVGGFSATGPVTDPTLVQAGTEGDCNGGPSYYAWWEVLPLPSMNLSTTTYPVKPGDQMTVTLTSNLVLWTLTLQNHTENWTSTNTAPYAASGMSVEWIQEAPTAIGTGGTGVSTLSNFGTVGFSGLTVNTGNPHLVNDNRVTMTDANGKVIASPSAPGTNGDSFTVCYGSGAC